MVRIQRINTCHIPACEVIARAGGGIKSQVVVFDVVEFGVTGGILAAVHHVGDGVFHRLPACIQRHGALGNVRIEDNVVGLVAVRRAEPAQEFIVLALGIFGNMLYRQTNIFKGHFVGILLLAVVQLVG